MKNLLAWRVRRDGVKRATMAYYAIPLAVPLLVASLANQAPATPAIPSAHATLLPVRYELALQPTPSLPAHTSYIAIGSGDTLDSILTTGGLTSPESHQISTALAGSIDPRKLRLGDLVRFEYDEKKAVQRVGMKVTGWGQILATRDGESFRIESVAADARSEQVELHAAIETSLYDALRGAGQTPQLVQQLVDVFQWDIDFFRLQKGDSFSLIVEKKFVGADHVGYGPVLAARFSHQGQTYEAYRFEAPGSNPGYYTRTGTPVRKQFLKAPLKFTRITSGFTRRRYHPILHKFRAHPGIDYGAPTGTPVMATADGVVTYAGFGRGEGNHIKIRHNSRMVTCYLHLSRFAKSLKRGTRVVQGDVIGYVGSTGMSTGPHLDYRVSDSGKWLNPLQLKSITPDSLHGESLRRFRSRVASYLPKLQESTAVASQKPAPRASF